VVLALQGVGNDVIMQALTITGAVTVAMMAAATVNPGFFLKLGRVLFFSLLILIVGGLVTTFILKVNTTIFTWLGAGIFTLYIGYDWARANQAQKTLNNAIDIASALFLDIINLFLRIVELLGKKRD